MTNSQTTAPAETFPNEEDRAQLEADMITLILLRSNEMLPWPRWSITKSGSFSLEFDSLPDLDAWGTALEALGARGNPTWRRDDGESFVRIMDGWSRTVYLRAFVPAESTSAPLDAETVAALEAVAR